MNKIELIRRTFSCHEAKFGAPPAFAAYAPGRVEVLGNHTDYNEGFVLSAAVDAGICFVLSPCAGGITLFAADLNESVKISPDAPGLPGGWAGYIAGVLIELRRLGAPSFGFEATFSGSIPKGAGLSSSAALEVAAALAVKARSGLALPKLEIARLCQRAEMDAVGVRCGLLDQISSLYGEAGALIHTDFRSLDITAVPVPPQAAFLICDTGVKHALVDSDYNLRRAQCEAARDFFAGRLNRAVRALRDVSPEELDRFGSGLDSETLRRASHIIGENDRVRRALDCLKNGDLAAFGALMFESHQSSIDQFENSCAELDQIVQSAGPAGALGARLSGGGFGGSAIVLTPAGTERAVVERLTAGFAERFNRPLPVRPAVLSGGAAVVSFGPEI